MLAGDLRKPPVVVLPGKPLSEVLLVGEGAEAGDFARGLSTTPSGPAVILGVADQHKRIIFWEAIPDGSPDRHESLVFNRTTGASSPVALSVHAD